MCLELHSLCSKSHTSEMENWCSSLLSTSGVCLCANLFARQNELVLLQRHCRSYYLIHDYGWAAFFSISPIVRVESKWFTRIPLSRIKRSVGLYCEPRLCERANTFSPYSSIDASTHTPTHLENASPHNKKNSWQLLYCVWRQTAFVKTNFIIVNLPSPQLQHVSQYLMHAFLLLPLPPVALVCVVHRCVCCSVQPLLLLFKAPDTIVITLIFVRSGCHERAFHITY